MAAVRHAARWLCQRALQQRGAQARSSVVADGQRRLLLNGTSPGRRLVSTSSVSGKPTQGQLELLDWQFKNKKEELFDLLLAVKRAELYPQLSWEDMRIHRLLTHLAAQVKPRPHDPNWRRFLLLRRLNDFNTICASLGYFGLLAYGATASIREDGAASKDSEATSVSEPKNDAN